MIKQQSLLLEYNYPLRNDVPPLNGIKAAGLKRYHRKTEGCKLYMCKDTYSTKLFITAELMQFKHSMPQETVPAFVVPVKNNYLL